MSTNVCWSRGTASTTQSRFQEMIATPAAKLPYARRRRIIIINKSSNHQVINHMVWQPSWIKHKKLKHYISETADRKNLKLGTSHSTPNGGIKDCNDDVISEVEDQP